MFEKYAKARTTSNKEEWLSLRKLGIGGSDSGAVLGVNKYKSKVDLWNEKKGLVEVKDISNKPAVAKGIAMEPILRKIFEIEHEAEYEVLEDHNTYFSIEYPFMLANVDGVLINKSNGELVGLEIKTANVVRISDWEEIPDYYYTQVQHYMIVLGLKKFILYAYITSPYQTYLKEFVIEADEDDQKFIIEKEKEFFESLKNDVRPKEQLVF